MRDDALGVGPDEQMPAVRWEQRRHVLPPPNPKHQDGRPRMDDRQLVCLAPRRPRESPAAPAWGLQHGPAPRSGVATRGGLRAALAGGVADRR